jgi:hypothetical protein
MSDKETRIDLFCHSCRETGPRYINDEFYVECGFCGSSEITPIDELADAYEIMHGEGGEVDDDNYTEVEL